ncbi:Dual oxidase like protein [Argiope bruennichi]|uniref:Dual oxidase like protein n=1 Tax=Argiope bruennichi TaxID=94029 RepID=A0A8T0E4V6_ARGBR|nr:Dual oxidase like protein [Argiope bruennichi]
MGLRLYAQRLGILVYLFLLTTGASSDTLSEEEPLFTHTEKQRYDGWYNNLAHPDWGSIDSQLTRKAPPSYSDGVYQMAGSSRPGARSLSQALMKGGDGLASRRNLTVLFTFFGQVAASEVLMASESGCPIEVQKIEVGTCDDAFDRECKGTRLMPFHRALYDHKTGQSPNSPREQLNQMTSWIDGSFVYSTSEAWVNSMRTFQNGTFRSTEGRFPPRNHERVPLINYPPARYLGMQDPEKMFLLGDPRIHQNPALLSLGVVFHRWHNVMAERIIKQHPDWTDEDIFQRARRWVIATLQNIILYEYLPLLLMEPVTPYQGYQPDLHPGVSHVFQSAAFRFGHTLIPPGLYKRTAQCEFRKTMTGYPAVRLCSTWWDSEEVESGIEELLMGMASQIAEREDNVLCSDVRDKLFGPMEFSRRDLAALNIMRGRDNGLPDYNTVRRYFQLPEVKNCYQISDDCTGPLDDVIGNIGGFAETSGGKAGAPVSENNSTAV